MVKRSIAVNIKISCIINNKNNLKIKKVKFKLFYDYLRPTNSQKHASKTYSIVILRLRIENK